ncbi:hypothetical protein [Amycolatopsis sp. CA-230715]|uniref:hypothetical protein n=1 Tax=Amycolatopsis sp. CA-230715 TaxID=2745196 RepID=UPI001C024D4B|nr:hypothetical protein [Amycolatopsis sp. CA-230715]QWF85559.1 hypothetical protein HUW46_09014 [Amycolatopsis sp. CA-230715]
MPLSAKVRDRCRAYLKPGEEIRYLFPGTSVRIGGIPGMVPFLVAVTDGGIAVLGCRGRFRRHRPNSVFDRLPRDTRLGPVDTEGSLGPTVEIGDVLLEIDEEYVPVIRAADLELAGENLPRDPLPDL